MSEAQFYILVFHQFLRKMRGAVLAQGWTKSQIANGKSIMIQSLAFLIGLLLGFLVSACSSFPFQPPLTPSPTPFPPPTGTFGCFGIERGLYASVGELILHPDGTLEFLGEDGRWTYNPDTRQLTFQENKYLASGIYDPERNFLGVTLQPGVAISHAEGGEMSCQPLKK